MRFSKGNLILILVFVGGIIMPTAILSFLGFRNIQNEMFLAQKNFDENQAAFQKDIEDAIAKEQEKIYQEPRPHRCSSTNSRAACSNSETQRRSRTSQASRPYS